MTTATTTAFRVCAECGHHWPETHFRWRKVGVTRRSECRFCHREYERLRSRRAREKRRARTLRQGCRAIAQADDFRDVTRLVRKLLRHFHGPRLARMVCETIDAARPGSPVIAHVALAVVKLNLFAESIRPEPALPATLAEQRAALERELTALLLEKPNELAELLVSAGWDVKLPE